MKLRENGYCVTTLKPCSRGHWRTKHNYVSVIPDAVQTKAEAYSWEHLFQRIFSLMLKPCSVAAWANEELETRGGGLLKWTITVQNCLKHPPAHGLCCIPWDLLGKV